MWRRRSCSSIFASADATESPERVASFLAPPCDEQAARVVSTARKTTPDKSWRFDMRATLASRTGSENRGRSQAERELQPVRQRRVVGRREALVAAPPLHVDERAGHAQRGVRIAAERSGRERVEVDREHAAAIVRGQRIAAGARARPGP